MLRHFVTFLGVLSIVVFGAAIASAAFVSVLDLGVPTGFTISGAYDFNSSGDVIVQSGTTVNAFLWSGGTYTNMGNLGYNYAYPRGINDSGTAVGYSKYSSSKGHAFKWTSGGGMVDLGSLYGTTGTSRAMFINADGDIVGDTQISSTITHAYIIYAGTTTMVDLGSLGYNSTANKIKDSGRIIGVYYPTTSTKPIRGFFYDGTMTDIGTLGDAYDSSVAYGLNNNDVVVGYSKGSVPGQHAISWTSGGGMVDLGLLPGGQEYSAAEEINDLGQIVGVAKDSTGAYRAVMWSSEITDLNSLIDPASGWVLQWAKSIDDSGTIVGWGEINGVRHAFMLTIPEPSTLALLATGLIGLLAYAWRKRK